MAKTLGQKITEGRRMRGMTQEALAETLGVTPQAVSNWENDLTCPDIAQLPRLAALLGTSIDALLAQDDAPIVRLQPKETKKNPDDMILHIRITSHKGDRVNVNLPILLIRACLDTGMLNAFFEDDSPLHQVDLNKVLQMVDLGVVGRLVEVNSFDGDTVEIEVD